jgi:sn-glycerol 3-phosphate transport system substrate-binding protein
LLALSGCGWPTITPRGTRVAAVEIDYTGVKPASEISFWSNHPGGSLDVERALIAAFQEATGIKVNLVTAGATFEEMAEKFQIAQTSRSVGDVVVLSDVTWFSAYLNDSIIPLDAVLEAAHTDVDKYQSALYRDYLYGTSHYAIPYARSTPIFYYNKKHYRQAGLPDRAPTTWAEVHEFAQRLKASGVNAAPFGYPPADMYPAYLMSNLVWSYGGGWSNDWDLSPLIGTGTRDALTYAQTSVQQGLAMVTSGDHATAFAAGVVSQVAASTAQLADILSTAQFDVGVGFLPTGPANTTAIVPSGGAGLGIAAKSSPDRQLAAAMFISFLTNAANTVKLSSATGLLPVRVDAQMDQVYARLPQFRVAVEQLPRVRSQDYARVRLPGGDRAIALALQTILTTHPDVENSLKLLEAQLHRFYDHDVAPRLSDR